MGAPDGGGPVRAPVDRRPLGPGLSLLVVYAVESGLPLPVPEDVFVLYLGFRSCSSPMLAVTGLGIMVVACLGWLNLYLVSTRLGPGLVRGVWDGSCTSTRCGWGVERWFRRWGPPAIVFGRDLPGPPIPIPVTAGTFGVRVHVFVGSMLVSVAAWVAIELLIGARLGRPALELPQLHVGPSAVVAALLGVVALGLVLAPLRALSRRRKTTLGLGRGNSQTRSHA